MYELRYLVRSSLDGSEKVLQYRTQIEMPDYGAVDPRTGGFMKKKDWTEWRTVPTVEDK